MESSSLPGSSKRAKAPGNIAQVAHCLVDGCDADLSQCREYHRRHKVCELHSKTSKVTIKGQEQRFCQQCSRFHSLVEFDEGKRSCRKRLDGHNRRRRKPQPDSLSKSSGLLFPGQQGARLLSFSNPQLFPTWPGVLKAENDIALYNNGSHLNYSDRQNSFPESPANSYKGANQFQFIQGTDHTPPEASICQPLVDPNSALGNSSSNQKLFPDELNRVVDSERALSLLSSAPAVTREIGLSHMVQPDSAIQAPSLAHNLHYSSLPEYPFSQHIESKPTISASDSHVSDNASLHFHEMMQNGPDGSSTSGSHQTLTFMWE